MSTNIDLAVKPQFELLLCHLFTSHVTWENLFNFSQLVFPLCKTVMISYTLESFLRIRNTVFKLSSS